jgi:predicted PurR-regulated permease PerM
VPDFRTHTRLATLLSVLAVLTLLWWAKAFLMPLALAVLIAFLLTPPVYRLESWGLNRVLSVVTVAFAAFVVIGFGIYLAAAQMMDLANSLPEYKDNLSAKIAAVKVSDGGPISRVTETFDELSRQLDSTRPRKPVPQAEVPLPVEVVGNKSTALTVLRDVAGPILAPIGSAAMIVVFVIFMLIERQDLRDRFIHLVGRGRLNVTTQAIDEAAGKVSRYLGAQLLVNVTYGIPIGLGLYFIGVPNAALWGVFTIILRFIPYLGPWIAATMPILLSFAISPGWFPPVATVLLFVVVELLSNNVVEPWLYGASTGLSPVAVIVSAVFWTWLWGTGGLLLATPLTVCLAVIGKYVPALSFLDILLGAKPPIAPEHRFYQRLLAGDDTELLEVIDSHVTRGEMVELFDGIVLPALCLAERDSAAGFLEKEDLSELHQCLREALSSVADLPAPSDDQDRPSLVIVPARTVGDELAGLMLRLLLHQRGVDSTLYSARTLSGEILGHLQATSAGCVLVSATTRNSVRAGQILARKLGAGLSPSRRLVGAWMTPPPKGIEGGEVQYVSTLREALSNLVDSSQVVVPSAEPATPLAA